ncbi:MAG: hypothetical protein U0235_18650 [Polyangiaceae bacterium]
MPNARDPEADRAHGFFGRRHEEALAALFVAEDRPESNELGARVVEAGLERERELQVPHADREWSGLDERVCHEVVRIGGGPAE